MAHGSSAVQPGGGGSSASRRPPWRAVWNAGADLASRRALLGLWCWRYHGIPGRHLLRRMLLPCGPLLELRLGGGRDLRLCLRRDDRGDHAAFFEHFFDAPLTATFCEAPGIIADVGAHVGCFSAMAHGLWPQARIVAFEPEAGNAGLLRQNFRMNRIPGEVVPMAVWTQPARMPFVTGQSNGGFLAAGTKPREMGPAARGTVDVDATSLSAYFGDELARVGLVKLDIEGAELAVLEQELPRLAPTATVLCELHFDRRHRGDLEAVASRTGWRAHLHDARHPPHTMWVLRRS